MFLPDGARKGIGPVKLRTKPVISNGQLANPDLPGKWVNGRQNDVSVFVAFALPAE